MKRLAQKGEPNSGIKDKAVVPEVEKICLSSNCPTKKPKTNFINDYYDENPNVDDRAEKIEADYQSSVGDGGYGGQSRKTKVFEADYVHFGSENLRPRTCRGCRVLNIVISDITNDKRKVLSDMKYTL